MWVRDASGAAELGPRGHRKKSVTPVVGVRVRGQKGIEAKKGSGFPYREAPKNAGEKIEKKRFFVKTFRQDCFAKRFFVVFLNSHR
jgi:hypothetical protein